MIKLIALILILTVIFYIGVAIGKILAIFLPINPTIVGIIAVIASFIHT